MDRLPITLSDASGVPFYRQIVDQVSEMVQSGQLPPGTRLPSFRELAGQLLVSLITVRRAYSDLEAAGLIQRRQGQGTFVAEEVTMVAREQVLAGVRSALTEAIGSALRIGMSPGEVRRIVNELLGDGGVGHGG